MSTFLLTWNPDEWEYEKLQDYLDAHSSGRKNQRWSCGNTKNIPLGSRVFLTKQGKGPRGLFGSGHVCKEPFVEPHFNEEKRRAGKASLYVEVTFDHLYDPLVGIQIDRAELGRFDSMIWDLQGSGKTIPADTASSLESLWLEKTGGVDIPYADEIPIDSTVREGASRTVRVNSYERNPEARERCIRKWGSNCVVCGFHFEFFYGQIGKGYIHVHHLKPLSQINKEYEINPEQDLRPVCPNCHAMLHRGAEVLSIEELQKLVHNYGSRG